MHVLHLKMVKRGEAWWVEFIWWQINNFEPDEHFLIESEFCWPIQHLKIFEYNVMDQMFVPPPQPMHMLNEALTPSVMVFRDGAFGR